MDFYKKKILVTGGNGYIGSHTSIKLIEAGYSIIIFAIIYGMILYNEIPDLSMILGTVIIILTGIYTLYRERSITIKNN